MPPTKKRKTESGSEPTAPASKQCSSPQPQEQVEAAPSTVETTTTDNKPSPSDPAPPEAASAPGSSAAVAAAARLARFKALQARAKTSSASNLQAASQETKRLAANPSALAAIQRKSATASQKLLRAEVEEAGEDFERKRAWDWTVDESEAWDKHVRKKANARDGVAFQDYRMEANKVYKRQLKNLSAPDLERYDRERLEAVQKAARSGELEIVETEDGEVVAVDKSGAFYADADSTGFAQHKPDREAIKRVVADVNRADEQRMKKRKERMARNGDEGDVTYINEKNKQFNQKLERYYNKYTAEIRDSFERGTMI